ncbi:MAG TPA: endonuclease [Anaerolineae bacterium]|nr:endonuclease [Anaerolineae bacterium]
MIVYLLHFQEPYKHARHYLGFCKDLTARLEQHRNGTGARLLSVVQAAGISWIVARTWDGGRDLERRLKARKNSPKLCPICRAMRRAAHEHDGGMKQ